jgi:hypothetical protein
MNVKGLSAAMEGDLAGSRQALHEENVGFRRGELKPRDAGRPRPKESAFSGRRGS